MGGGGTTSYAQRYPDMYCAAYAMSALMNITVSGEEVGKDPDPTNKMAVLTRSVQEHSCIKMCIRDRIYTSNPQLSSSASFLRLNVLSSLN